MSSLKNVNEMQNSQLNICLNCSETHLIHSKSQIKHWHQEWTKNNNKKNQESIQETEESSSDNRWWGVSCDGYTRTKKVDVFQRYDQHPIHCQYNDLGWASFSISWSYLYHHHHSQIDSVSVQPAQTNKPTENMVPMGGYSYWYDVS